MGSAGSCSLSRVRLFTNLPLFLFFKKSFFPPPVGFEGDGEGREEGREVERRKTKKKGEKLKAEQTATKDF